MVPERRALGRRADGRVGQSSSAVSGSCTIARILSADELRGDVVGVLVDEQVVERLEQEPEAADLPPVLEDPPAPRPRRRRRSPARPGSSGTPNDLRAHLLPDRRVVRLDRAALGVVDRAVAGGDHVVRGPLEDRQVLGGLARPAGSACTPVAPVPIDADPLAGELDVAPSASAPSGTARPGTSRCPRTAARRPTTAARPRRSGTGR